MSGTAKSFLDMNEDELAVWRAEAQRAEEEKRRELMQRVRRLPCFEATEAGNASAGIKACESACAYRACEFAQVPRYRDVRQAWDCPRRVEEESFKDTVRRLHHAGVEARESGFIRAAHPGHRDDGGEGNRLPVVPLKDTDALSVVRAFMARKAATVRLHDGAEVPLSGDETLLVLAGRNGPGKTLAACSALGQRSGRYITATMLEPLDAPVEKIKTDSGLLVLDDAGTEHVGATGFVVDRIVDVLATRYSRLALTIVTTNLTRPTFAQRYGARLDDRLNDGGIFVAITQESMRKRGRS